MQVEQMKVYKNIYISYMKAMNEGFFRETIKNSNLKVSELVRYYDLDVSEIRSKLSSYFIRNEIINQCELFMVSDNVVNLKTMHELFCDIIYFHEKTENERLFDKTYNELYHKLVNYVLSGACEEGDNDDK